MTVRTSLGTRGGLGGLLIAAVLVAVLASGDATAQQSGDAPSPFDADFGDTPGGVQATPERDDPLETINRPISDFNRFLRKLLLDPAVEIYQLVLPDALERAIANASSNLREPFNVVGSLVAGDAEGAQVATQRFVVNTTLGIGGVRDVATEAGLQYCREDIGQGLAARGAEPGAHIVAPIIGPTNMRDLPGQIAEIIVSPLPGVVSAAQAGVDYAEKKDAVQALDEGAVDKYVAEREAYEQSRLYQVEITCKLPKDQEAKRKRSE